MLFRRGPKQAEALNGFILCLKSPYRHVRTVPLDEMYPIGSTTRNN
jgi:hypothetical protein